MKEMKKTGLGSRFIERGQLKGLLRYTVFKNGIPVETVEKKNLIVNGARVQMAYLVAGNGAGRHITKIAFGTNGTNPTLADTVMTNAYEKPLSAHSYPEPGQVQFDWKLETTEANGMAIMEFGLVTGDGTLFSRRVRENGTPINKAEDISIEGQWIIIF
jgi:hypothetical protein